MLEPVYSLVSRTAPLLSFAAAAWIVGRMALREARGFGLPVADIAEMTSTLAISTFVAARLAAVLPHWRMIVDHPLDLLRVTDGLSFAGGVFGASGGLVFLSLRARLPIPTVADLYGLLLPLGVAVYGVTCLLRNDCYGKEAPAPFGIVFRGMQTGRYPVELYAASLALFAFGGLQMIRGRLSAGGLALASFAALAISRIFVDLFRLDSSNRFLSDDQVVSLAIAGTSLALLVFFWARNRIATAPHMMPSNDAMPGIVERT